MAWWFKMSDNKAVPEPSPETGATVQESVTVEVIKPPLPLENVNVSPVMRQFTLSDFIKTFRPLNRNNEVVTVLDWPEVQNLCLGLIGPDKLKAKAAAAHQLCWTVAKHAGKLRIEAGFNPDEPEKFGYIVTNQPWIDLEQTVVQ